jgi:murein DD-endopeptidase MepM/ murein hydrolase activator NlpD
MSSRAREVPDVRVLRTAMLARWAGLILVAGASGMACGSGTSSVIPDSAPLLAVYNAYWHCPSATPRPTVTPEPTHCEPPGEPSPFPPLSPLPPLPTLPGGASPTPRCSLPRLTATPYPTATPYGRQVGTIQGGTSASTFYAGQQVRIGPLRIALLAHRQVDPAPGGEIPHVADPVAHVWDFEVKNEGSETFTVTWPLRMVMREVVRPDGQPATGKWFYTPWAAHAAEWHGEWQYMVPGKTLRVSVPIEAPRGEPVAVGFAPNLESLSDRRDAPASQFLVWFSPRPDPSGCEGNTAGPVLRREDGVVWQEALPTPKSALPPPEGRFEGWPVNRGTPISQAYGCTSFPEVTGYNCPSRRPWFHAGVDLDGAKGDPLYAVMDGQVEFVGVSSGVRCKYKGSEEPRTNLGWVIQIRSGPYLIKYGHTIVNSQRVAAGDRVHPGQLIGLMGSTGCSTGAHLHFQVQNSSGFVDPFTLITTGR